jgi:hypothetical protein
MASAININGQIEPESLVALTEAFVNLFQAADKFKAPEPSLTKAVEAYIKYADKSVHISGCTVYGSEENSEEQKPYQYIKFSNKGNNNAD